jgi:hypothetical protein
MEFGIGPVQNVCNFYIQYGGSSPNLNLMPNFNII